MTRKSRPPGALGQFLPDDQKNGQELHNSGPFTEKSCYIWKKSIFGFQHTPYLWEMPYPNHPKPGRGKGDKGGVQRFAVLRFEAIFGAVLRFLANIFAVFVRFCGFGRLVRSRFLYESWCGLAVFMLFLSRFCVFMNNILSLKGKGTRSLLFSKKKPHDGKIAEFLSPKNSKSTFIVSIIHVFGGLGQK